MVVARTRGHTHASAMRSPSPHRSQQTCQPSQDSISSHLNLARKPSSQASGAAALLAAYRGPRVRRPRGALAALTVHVVRDLTQVRAVRALDGGGGSRSSSDKLSLGEKVEAAAAAKPSMRSPR
eukprot:4907885-Prymnesium_polylepis.1